MIHELELLGFEGGEYPLVEFRTVCSSGTYVRSLADDIAASLGGRAHLTALRRTAVGSLRVEDAAALSAYVEEPERITRTLLPLAAGLADLPQLQVANTIAERVAHGAKVPLADLPVASSTAVLDAGGRLLAVYCPGDAVARAEVVVV
jgi:tRNA pseudouridine55 synthase